jgi:two-component system, NarL family, invasion response regulator UvrY
VIRILLADDHTIVRRGLVQLLSLEPQVTVAYEANDGNEALRYLRAHAVDVVIIDISMPGRSGLEILKEIKRQRPKVAVIVLSMHPADQYAVRVLKAGAAAYITKESAPEVLIDAIRKASRGDRYISPEVAELLADFVEHGTSDEPHKGLSDREFEVLRLIASGKAITEISEELCISVKTVSTYKSRITEKTGLGSPAEMTRYSMEHGLI